MRELGKYGYSNEEAKRVTLRHYRVMKRNSGFYLNANDFTKEINELEIALKIKYDPSNPDHIPLEPIRQRIRKTKALKHFSVNRLVEPKEIKLICQNDPEVIEAFIHSLIAQFTVKLNEHESRIKDLEQSR